MHRLLLLLPYFSICATLWVQSSPVNPLPKDAVMISNATLNPVPVYECAVKIGNAKYAAGALAYERAWRCMYFDPNATNNLKSAGPGSYQVYTDTFGTSKKAQATSAKPFPSNTIVPLVTVVF